MKSLIAFLFVCVIGWTATANAELVVIANKNLDTSGLTKKKIIDIYMGRHALSSNEVEIIPLDQPEDSQAKHYFYQTLMNKKISEINAYWARLLFSGKGMPPMIIETEDEIINIITHNLTMIGYVDSKKLTSNTISSQVQIITNVE